MIILWKKITIAKEAVSSERLAEEKAKAQENDKCPLRVAAKNVRSHRAREEGARGETLQRVRSTCEL